MNTDRKLESQVYEYYTLDVLPKKAELLKLEKLKRRLDTFQGNSTNTGRAPRRLLKPLPISDIC